MWNPLTLSEITIKPTNGPLQQHIFIVVERQLHVSVVAVF
jgi:hypothetical protein